MPTTGTGTETINDYNGRDYRTVWQHPRAKQEDKFEGAIVRSLLPKYGGWFLDLGGGYGRLYPMYKRPGRKVVIADYALNLLELAEKEHGKEGDIFFVAANAYYLPFKSATFDSGVSVRVFHHMGLPQKFLEECGRVMRSGSEFVMEYANKRNLFRLLIKSTTATQVDHEEYEPLHYGTHPVFFKDIAGKAGFTVRKTFGTGFFPRFITESTAFLTPAFTIFEHIFDTLFGQSDLCPLLFSDIQKNPAQNEMKPGEKIEDILCCPACKGDLSFVENVMSCAKCNLSFKKQGAIFDLRYSQN